MPINIEEHALLSLAHYTLSCDLSFKRYMAAGRSRGETPEVLRQKVQYAQRWRDRIILERHVPSRLDVAQLPSVL
jgi:hypothetical protein